MIRVLGRASSSNVQKVMWCAAELGLEVDRVDMGLEFGGNNTPEYLAKNPTGLVPTLEDGDLVVWESNTIVRYLADTYGKGDWATTTPAQRALNSQWMDLFSNTLGPHMGVIFRTLTRTPEPERDMAALKRAVDAAAKAWKLLDAELANAPYLSGKAPGIGDIPAGCAVYRWYNLPIERPKFANVEAWYERLKTREPYRTHVMLPL
jgi:glutathione S-transferase